MHMSTVMTEIYLIIKKAKIFKNSCVCVSTCKRKGETMLSDDSMVHSSSCSRVFCARGELDSSRWSSLSSGLWSNMRNDIINAGISCSQEQELDRYLKTLTPSKRPRLTELTSFAHFSSVFSHCTWVEQPNLVLERCIARPCPVRERDRFIWHTGRGIIRQAWEPASRRMSK